MCSQAEITCCHSTIQSIWAPSQCHQTAYSLAVPVGQVPQPPSHIPTWVSYCNRTLWWWCHRCLVATSVLPTPWSTCELCSQARPDREETSTQLMPRRSFVSPTSPPLKILVAQRQACKCPSPGPHTGGKGAWKPTKTSWVHCRLWLKVPATYPPITDWVHSKCSCRFQVEHIMWVHLCNILNVILTCTIHLIPHNS